MDVASHHPSDELLSRFHDGGLSGVQAAQIESHLAQCPDCVTRLERLPSDSRLIQLIRGLEFDISDATPIPGEIRFKPATEAHGGADKR